MNPAYTSVDGVLFDKALSTLLQCPGGKTGAYRVPGTVTAIGLSAFANCRGVTSVTIPEGVQTIGNSAFLNCSSLASATIPQGVSAIGEKVFFNCTNLARFYNPAGVSVDTNGALTVADENNSTIRQVTASGGVSTLAGKPGSSGPYDGTNSQAWFYQPRGVAVNRNGIVYVADTVNCALRRITPEGVVTTLAGLAYQFGSADGTNETARFAWPEGLAVDKTGVLYVADTGNHTIRKVTPDGIVTTLAGAAGSPGGADGSRGAARLNFPVAIAADGRGNLFVVERNNHTVRRIAPDGAVTTIGGLAGVPGSADEVGAAARFNSPQGIAIDGSGVLYIADSSNNRITRGLPILPAVIGLVWNGANLHASWPDNCLGWELQSSSNLLETNWVTVIGSTNSTSASIPVDPAAPSLFYRLRRR